MQFIRRPQCYSCQQDGHELKVLKGLKRVIGAEIDPLRGKWHEG